MQQRVGDVKEIRVAERRQIGAVGHEEQRQYQQTLPGLDWRLTLRFCHDFNEFSYLTHTRRLVRIMSVTESVLCAQSACEPQGYFFSTRTAVFFY